MSDAAINQLLSRLEQVTNRLESVEKQLASGGGGGGAAASAGSAESGAASVSAFDALVSQFAQAVAGADKFGDDALKEQVQKFKAALASERELLNIAAQSKKPGDVAAFLQPTSAAMGAVGEVREKNRASKLANHLTALAEAVNGLGWVAVSPTPGPFVDDARQSAEFYTNRILKEFKDKDADHVAFARGVVQFLKDLRAYVKDHHTTGLTWNAKGGDAKAPSGAAAPAPAAGGAPPPPAGLASDIASSSKKTGGDGQARAGLFAELSKGGDVTKGLKKITPEMQTHKNTALRAGATVPTESAKKAPAKKWGGNAAAKQIPEKLALEGNKWVVEGFKNKKDIEIAEVEPRHVVYLYKLEGCVVQIKGKINSITLDACKKTAVVFQDVIASVETVNCTSLQLQCDGKLPSLAIDNTSGTQLFVKQDALESLEIIQSKSTESNVAYTGSDGELVEVPLPEQFCTTVKDLKFVTTPVEHV